MFLKKIITKKRKRKLENIQINIMWKRNYISFPQNYATVAQLVEQQIRNL